MLRARAPAGQGLGGPCRRRRRRTATGWLLDGHETVPLQAFEHSERRRQQFAALAVVPTPACDLRLDDGDQELGCCPSVTRFHRRAADPGEPFIQKSPEPSAPTRSPTTDSIRAKLIPGDSDDFRRSYYRAYVRLESLASDIRESVPKYLERLQTDKSACNRFRKCMERFFPRACRDNDPDEA
jgi:hypothetical protein